MRPQNDILFFQDRNSVHASATLWSNGDHLQVITPVLPGCQGSVEVEIAHAASLHGYRAAEALSAYRYIFNSLCSPHWSWGPHGDAGACSWEVRSWL